MNWFIWHLTQFLKAIFWGLVFIGFVLGVLFLCTTWVGADDQIANAIYLAEGGKKARQAYGIEGYKCTGGSCRKIALNTIRNQRARHSAHQCSFTYLECLSRRYCPPNHVVWLKNVKWFLENPKLSEVEK